VAVPPGAGAADAAGRRVAESPASLRYGMQIAMLPVMAQLVTRIDEALARDVDELVATGVVASRSEAVRLGLIELLRRVRREQVGRAIVAGYQAKPQTEAELGWADTATVRMIGDEPW
jgi:Arc/MetJ-type ribon-helix-helix transcriptional regulator